MNIKTKDFDSEKARLISERYSLDMLTSTILTRRGVELTDIKYYLENEFIYRDSPFLVDDIYTAIERIEEAIEEGEKIMIFGDRDVDGVTATAILARTLKKLGVKDLTLRLPEGDESYGLSDKIVKEILEKDITLLITVDNGISANEEIKRLELEGVSVIVTDHHIPNLSLPPATAIIDPKIEGSGFTFDGYSGCSVASKLSWALFFAKSSLYNSRLILLHSQPGNDSIKISAVKLENLIEVDRLSVDVLLNSSSFERDRVINFLSCNLPIVVLDEKLEKNMLQKALGLNVDISLQEFRTILESVMPSARGKSLFDLSSKSRAAKYVNENKELETLISLFKSVSIFREKELSKEFETIMQIEAIGTIADLMPMKGENRLIVKKGLNLLSTRPAIPFFELLNRQNLLGKPITAKDISFKVAPVLNAAGRIGKPSEALNLLLSDNYEEAEKFVDILLARNKERQKIEEEIVELVKDKANKSLEEFNNGFIFIDDERIPRGITGSISSKLHNEFQVPVIVIASLDERASGSLRSDENFNAKEFLSNFSYLFEDYGGHKAAAGFSIALENVENLKGEIKEFLSSFESDEDDEKEDNIYVDALVPESFVNEKLWQINKVFEPYGQNNEPLKLYLKSAVIEELYNQNGQTSYLRGLLKIKDDIWPFVWWKCKNASSFKKGSLVEIIFSPETNYFRGEAKEQILVQKMELIS